MASRVELIQFAWCGGYSQISERRLSVDSVNDDPARNKAQSLVVNMTHLGDNCSRRRLSLNAAVSELPVSRDKKIRIDNVQVSKHWRPTIFTEKSLILILNAT